MDEKSISESGTRQEAAASAEGEITTIIGTTSSSEAVIQDLALLPHILIYGFSGAGKTSFIRSVLTDISASYSQQEVQYAVYDSSSVNYSVFNGLPHMLNPVIVDGQTGKALFEWLNQLTANRLRKLARASAKDIQSFNRQARKNGTEPLAHLFIVLDDYSSIEMNAKSTSYLSSILRNGRAAGVHLILITSLTSSRVLPKDVLSNLPCRISFCVSTKADSRVAIDQQGAEALSVPGELIFRLHNRLVKCQGTYYPYEDIEKTLTALKLRKEKDVSASEDMAAQGFDEKEPSKGITERSSASTVKGKVYDKVLPDAIEAAIAAKQCSVSMLQR